MAYWKKGFWRSYTVTKDGCLVAGFNSKKEAIRRARVVGGIVTRCLEKGDRSYSEEAVVFVS